jgi:hypothetical protein
MATEVKNILEQTQAGIFRELIELAPREKRARAVHLVEQYGEIARAISMLGSSQHGARYASCQYPIDAIVLLLQDMGRPAPAAEIVEGVATSGWRPGNDALNRGNVKKSLKQYLVGQAKSKSPIKQVGDLIGLIEWDDQIFHNDLSTV